MEPLTLTQIISTVVVTVALYVACEMIYNAYKTKDHRGDGL